MRRVDNGAVKHDAGERINELAEQVLTQVDSLLGRHHIVPNAVQ
ncbi:glycine dehydrogenase, partial [Micromonospora sp. BL1]